MRHRRLHLFERPAALRRPCRATISGDVALRRSRRSDGILIDGSVATRGLSLLSLVAGWRGGVGRARHQLRLRALAPLASFKTFTLSFAKKERKGRCQFAQIGIRNVCQSY